MQSVEQVVPGAHSVLHPPAGQATLQDSSAELQVKLQWSGMAASPLAPHVQLAPEHEHCALGVVGSALQLAPTGKELPP